MLLAGAYAPLDGFLSRADSTAVERHGRLATDGVWPLVTLVVPDAALDPDTQALVLTDHEGAPLAGLQIAERWPARRLGHSHLSGPVRAVGDGGRAQSRRYRM